MVLHPRPKSKRQTSRHRAKVARKVREHGRKLRKEAKNKPGKGRKRKDPGIPSAFPQKEVFLEQLAADQQAEREHRQQQKSEAEKLRDMMDDAEKKGAIYAQLGIQSANQSKIMSSVPDLSRKAFYREFNQVVGNSDVVLMVLDARDPLGCRVQQVEEAVREAGKRLVLVLNKSDLVPVPVVKLWLAHLRRFFPTVAFRASRNSQNASLGNTVTAEDALGADQLISLLKNYARSHNIKTTITVGVVGYPNVGKSSLINSLKRAKVCRVGASPGITTVAQQVHLDRNINLLDCPGIVFSSQSDNGELFLRNVLRVEQLDDPIAPVNCILQRIPKPRLMAAFGCDWVSAGDEQQAAGFLRAVALVHGRLKKGGVPDLDAAARYVLKEWNAGKIDYWHEPPAPIQSPSDSCAIVHALAPEFKLDGLDDWLDEKTMVIDS